MIKLRMLAPTNELFIFEIWGPMTGSTQIRSAIVVKAKSEITTPDEWLADNLTEAQTLIDAGESDTLFTISEETKQFLRDNPNAKLLIKLSPDELETVIENRTAAQETLLLKTLAFAVRVWFAERRED